MQVQVIIPIYHPDEKFLSLLESLIHQKDIDFSVLVIDSGSDKKYMSVLSSLSAEVIDIDAKTFNHGGTRQMGIEHCEGNDIYIFLTQDAILKDENTLKKLIDCFNDETVGCAYGRQLPHLNAGVFASHARLCNYGSQSYVYSYEDRVQYGMKTVFISNSFAAYRRDALIGVGGFPVHIILCEDMYTAAKIISKGWKIAYCAEAQAYHSHDYSILQEFRRYFDIGVFHASEPWIRNSFGAAEGAGRKFVLSEMKYIFKRNILLLLPMVIRDAMKFAGYRLGIHFNCLPKKLCAAFSMMKTFWKM